jgi:hypothetical protein
MVAFQRLQRLVIVIAWNLFDIRVMPYLVCGITSVLICYKYGGGLCPIPTTQESSVKRIADILLSVAVDDSEIVVSLNDYHQARNKVPVFHMHLCHYTIFEFYTSNAYPQGIDIVVGYISDEAIKIDKDKLVAGVTIRDDYFEYKAGCATFRPGSSWRNAPL